MAFTPYVKQTWVDNSSPPSAARFNFMEQGIFDAHFKPGCKATSIAAQSIANATFTPVSFAAAFASEVYDTNAMHDPTTNPTRFIAKVAGRYTVYAWWSWTLSLAGNNRYARLAINGSLVMGLDQRSPTSTGAEGNASGAHQLAVNDYVELVVYQDTGGALALTLYSLAMELTSY